MRKEYRKSVINGFAKVLDQGRTGFVRSRPQSPLLLPSEIAFSKKCDVAVLTLIVVPHHMGAEMFSLQGGWSRSMSFPNSAIRPSGFVSDGRSEFQQDEFTFNVGELWNEPDAWWVVEEVPASLEDIQRSLQPISDDTAQQRTWPLIKDAGNRIRSYLLPYFEEFLAYSRERHRE